MVHELKHYDLKQFKTIFKLELDKEGPICRLSVFIY